MTKPENRAARDVVDGIFLASGEIGDFVRLLKLLEDELNIEPPEVDMYCTILREMERRVEILHSLAKKITIVRTAAEEEAA
jgi:hypothetical protein